MGDVVGEDVFAGLHKHQDKSLKVSLDCAGLGVAKFFGAHLLFGSRSLLKLTAPPSGSCSMQRVEEDLKRT